MSPIISSIITAVSASVAASLLAATLKKEVKDNSPKNDLKNSVEYQNFGNALTKSLKSLDSIDLNTIQNIYIGSGIHNLERKDTNIIDLLRIYMVDIYIDGWQLKEDEISSLVKKITKIIEDIDRTVPFDDLPLTERNLLKDINSFLNNNDKESVERKMNELAVSIKLRENHLNNLEKTNKNSNKVAIIGIVLTIVFGFMPFISSYIQKWITQYS